MNMSNITFEVPRLSTFVFRKYSRLYSWLRASRVLVGIMLADGGQTSFHNWANVLSYRGLLGDNASPVWHSEQTGQSPNYVSMLGQRRIRLTGIEPAAGCDAGLTFNRYWVGRPTLCVPGTSYRRVH